METNFRLFRGLEISPMFFNAILSKSRPDFQAAIKVPNLLQYSSVPGAPKWA
jgi:hypothetical protein